MPLTRTSSDLQRNIAEVYQLCEAQDEPVYITRNGHADLIVMNADAYERQALLSQQVRSYEMELRERAESAYESIRSGKGTPLTEVHREMGLS